MVFSSGYGLFLIGATMNRAVILFQVFYKYYGFYFRIIFRIVGNKEDTEDILYFKFSKVLYEKNYPTNEDDLKPWLVTVFKNEAVSFIKKRQKDKDREEMYYLVHPPERNFEDDLFFRLTVEELIKEMPLDLRKSFQEHFLDSVPIRVVCRKNGVSRDRMRYWMKKLRKIIKNL